MLKKMFGKNEEVTALTFEDFEKNVKNNVYGEQNYKYEDVLFFLKGAIRPHSEHTLVYSFYFRNAMNDKPKEIYALYADGFVEVTDLEKEQIKIIIHADKVIKKELILSKYPDQSNELRVTLESGETFTFNNIEDSNAEMAEEYFATITEMYNYF